MISDDGRLSGLHTGRCLLGYPPTPNSFTLQKAGVCSCLTPEQNTPNGVKSHNTSYKKAVPIFSPTLQFPFSWKTQYMLKRRKRSTHNASRQRKPRLHRFLFYQRRIYFFFINEWPIWKHVSFCLEQKSDLKPLI